MIRLRWYSGYGHGLVADVSRVPTPVQLNTSHVEQCSVGRLRKKGEIGNMIEEVVDLDRQMNSEVDTDDVQELLNSHN
ncbi:hypothetical protein TNCV_502601 [Trichonephila clavipes]|nr:hypothetical protein TNCV_502601 [Trichonephila clavipes]